LQFIEKIHFPLRLMPVAGAVNPDYALGRRFSPNDCRSSNFIWEKTRTTWNNLQQSPGNESQGMSVKLPCDDYSQRLWVRFSPVCTVQLQLIQKQKMKKLRLEIHSKFLSM
jgi:hypothetical protein